MNSATTGGITVLVETAYIEKDSDPDNQYFVWAYHIKIENNSADTVQLMSRHWMITDALGRQKEVRGAGVVGEQPVLAPGASFSYSSGTPLQTPSGFMRGTYAMRADNGREFDIEIPAFSLDCPHDEAQLH
ncbi:MAG: Co2+/Mg2+ efflux protein ApaG [Pseudomonadota bacterium]|nr:Co2+/Mg2+ efflux protein ApaG [Pseudomonadota bacterium]